MQRSLIGVALFWIVCGTVLSASAQAQTYSRTEVITYHDNTSKWVLGQVASVKCIASVPASAACDGDMVSQNSYGATYAMPTQTKAFGKITRTLAYDTTSSVSSGQRGTLRTVKDGNNNVTTTTNWKRGIPQTITFPATDDQPEPVKLKATVSNSGWITSITDENDYKTNYAYDAMGRLKKTTYPAGDAIAWNATNQSFSPSTTSRFGLPAGHWVQLIYTGHGRKMVDYDALWRPVVEQTFDNTDSTTSAATKSIVVKRYDAAGRLVFHSYPVSSITSYTDNLKGTVYSYDALGRVTTVKQDSELGKLTTTTAYQTGGKTKVVDPRGNVTTTSYKAYDQPSLEWPVAISHPGGAYTDIERDAFGKPLSITRRNGASTVSLTRSYTYNSAQELCAYVEPETGTTKYVYDGAGNLIKEVFRMPVSLPASCMSTFALGGPPSTGGSNPPSAAATVHRTYDARNRLLAVTFPDHRGDTTYAYTADSKLASITADNGGTAQVTTEYNYDRRRLMTGERMLWNTINWPVTYVYNANGHLSAQKWHGLNITYAPNALGQPTQAGTYASSVTYYPNGAIKSFTYGNNIKHTLTQNIRGLPDRSRDIYGSTVFLDDGYDYDQNGNVMAISDGTTGNAGDRTMTYDALDRLIKAVAPGMFGTATYTYDVLNNLTRAKLTGGQVRDYYYCYDTNWRLTNIKTGGCSGTTVMGLGYDAQGNVANRNGRTYTFDYGNRLRTVSGPTANYVYDGHGRRVRDIVGASKYSQYSSSGQLLQTSDGRRHIFSEYIYLQGSLVAIRERDTTTNVYTVKYQHTDALGSPVAITSQSRALLEKRKYEPYGLQITPAPQDGPGYTGHVYDAATGMVYMQQRYYDPAIGRFLSVDPIAAYSNPIGAFNRYWYASNNPYKFTDPDGRRIAFALANGATFADQAATMSYLYSSPTAAGELAQLHFSDQTYTIKFDAKADGMSYDRGSRTVIVNPTSGLRVKSSGEVQSPALGAGHEISHAAEHDRIGSEAMEQHLEAPVTGGLGSDGVYTVNVGISQEEARATSVESQIARELGEPARQDYHDEAGEVKTCSPTSGQQC